MPAKLIVAPEAEQDLAEAYGWYESQRREGHMNIATAPPHRLSQAHGA